jgi:ketosteroid isomerase-like protein
MTKAMMDSLRNDLLNTDIAFSAYAEQKGRNAAFLEYAADDATLLRPFSMPTTGRDSIAHMLTRHPDTAGVLTWIPISCDVAHSGEIGFTYGTYSVQLKDGNKEEGTYCIVWHKDKGKKWKFILDTSNEGLNSADKAIDRAEEAKEEKAQGDKK